LLADDPPYPLPPQQQKPIDMMYEVLGEDDYEDPTVWYERFKQIKREEQGEASAPKENTIRAHVDDYLSTRKTVARAENKLGTYNTIETRMKVFRKWVDPFVEISTLNEIFWERFCVHLAKRVNDGDLAAGTRAGIQRVVRAFIRNRWERRFIDLPRNLNNRTLSASVPLQEVVVFSKKEISSLLVAAPERTKLYILLALNCGFYGVDIAAIKQTEVDWSKGRICRQRTKTRSASANVPKVDYLLWRQTFDLLKSCRSKDSQLAMTNQNGSPLWSEIEKDGKFTRNNNVKTAYFRLWQMKFKKTKGFKSFKILRKTAASLLENHKEYGRYAEHFLGEVPSSIAGRHYVKPPTKQFDAAIRWLGKQLGIE
jgi:integrase